MSADTPAPTPTRPEPYLSGAAGALGVALGLIAFASAAAAAERKRARTAAAPAYVKTLETELEDRARQLVTERELVAELSDDVRTERHERELVQEQNRRLAAATLAIASGEVAGLVAKWRADQTGEADVFRECADDLHALLNPAGDVDIEAALTLTPDAIHALRCANCGESPWFGFDADAAADRVSSDPNSPPASHPHDDDAGGEFGPEPEPGPETSPAPDSPPAPEAAPQPRGGEVGGEPGADDADE